MMYLRQAAALNVRKLCWSPGKAGLFGFESVMLNLAKFSDFSKEVLSDTLKYKATIARACAAMLLN